MSKSEPGIAVRLPDGSELDMERGATVVAVAYEIGPGLGDDTVAGRIRTDEHDEWELVDKHYPLYDDVDLEIVTPGSDEYVQVMRHSAAHVLAEAVQRLYPSAKLAIGPPTAEGFYYDFADLDIDEDDLEHIETEMAAIIEADKEFVREEVSAQEARDRLANEPYKLELLEEFEDDHGPITFYRQNDWEDLCAGPHVESTGEIGAFTLREIAGAYWRGDEDNEMQTRIYGTAFESESALSDFLERKREAERRDHRKIGREMALFSIDETSGPGLPLYHPNGKTILRELESYVNEINQEQGYEFVETPHLFKTDLWKASGHYDNYRDDMFLFEVDGREYGLKPMNCPGHARIFDDHSWSYRDLPVRYAEHGKVYRKEQHGELSGLSRTWAFTIDDGHLFVRPDQIETEVGKILDAIDRVFETFGLESELQLATRPEQSVGSDEIWDRSETQLRAVLDARGGDYEIAPGDGAFYGPKIDFAFDDALGRQWDGPTVQLDFTMPERFDLSYVGEDNQNHKPVMIHRALYGSYERFFMMLIEHFAGNFPLWIAPDQVRLLPVAEHSTEYARRIAGELEDRGFRVDIDDDDRTVGRKIRAGHDDRVPYMVIVGEDERESDTISVRDRQEREKRGIDPEAFYDHLVTERNEQRLELEFLS